MALSPAHKFGQIIGEVLEASVEPVLRAFAEAHGLYLDRKGSRPARSGKKVRWTDARGNSHDLDYVIERGGTASAIGTPVGFMEVAWRRYTKHSRNKAQEIQGAILPLAETHGGTKPFIGVILGGVFTEGALAQLKSLGFNVVHFDYEVIKAAFATVGISADFDEATSDSDLRKRVKHWNRLTERERAKVLEELRRLESSQIEDFVAALHKCALRHVVRVHVLPLHGTMTELRSVQEAIDFVARYNEREGRTAFIRYEVHVHYNNEDHIQAVFSDKESAVRFLRDYL